MRAAVVAVTLMGGAACVLGCQQSSDPPPSYVAGLRVLAIKAEPPDVAPGGTSTVTALAIDGDGTTPSASWSRCTRPPLAGQAVNPDCISITGAVNANLVPVGQGLAVTATMPADATPAALGAPDATGGVYLPLIADVSVPTDHITASYRLRLTSGDPAGSPPNANPKIAGVFVDGAGGQTALDEATPLVVHAGDQITLSATFAPGSVESYTTSLPNGSGGVTTTSSTETLDVAWFATGGELTNDQTSDVQPETVLKLDKQLPAAGSTIDLYAVGRDERGGTDWVHRTLHLE